jgi:hypothetical protein
MNILCSIYTGCIIGGWQVESKGLPKYFAELLLDDMKQASVFV